MQSKVKTVIILILAAWAALSLYSQTPYRASGTASWYGPGFNGRLTANGERFDSSALTAAHRTLPFGTQLKVTNRANGKAVIVRINDRGPFAAGRIIDLSRGAAEVIGMIETGTARVILEEVGTVSIEPVTHSIQTGSFSSLQNAENMVNRLKSRNLSAEVVKAGSFYRVLITGIPEEAISEVLAKLEEIGITNPLIR